MHIHFIAIGGSIMHQLAIALHQKGYHITGSDDDIFDPARSQLAAHQLLPSVLGWHPNKITTDTHAVIVGMHAKADNPELLAAQALDVPIYSYPQYIYEQNKDKKRVVIGGSHGKTTITAMIMHSLRYWQYDFDYLVGAKLKGFDSSVRLTNKAPIIIIEGDEYLSSPIHRTPKFHHYIPNIALLTGIAWDHINVFPTFETYKTQFSLFTQTILPNQTLIFNEEDAHVQEVANTATHLHRIPYRTPNYRKTPNGWVLQEEAGETPLQIFGEHNMQNLMGAKAVCEQLGLTSEQFLEAIQQFTGASRRLELWINQEKNQYTVYRDFAHAPSKVKATTKAVKNAYPKRTFIACLELHTYSSLNKDFLPQYHQTLEPANEAIVFFNAHTFAIKKLPLLTKQEVGKIFDHPNLTVLTSKEALHQHLKQIDRQHTVCLFMSSGHFGGKLEEIVMI